MKIIFLLLLIINCSLLIAEELPDSARESTVSDIDDIVDIDEVDVIVLPEAEIVEERGSTDVVTREQMDREGALDLWEALRNVPGVVISGGGARNDSGFRVRGFDSASMPVFVDGVTTANPYRGDNDAARMLTADIESITVEKGYSTMLLGPNTMGGAIIIKTARPKERFEASATSGFELDLLGKYQANNDVVSIGGKGDLFYGKGTFQFRGVDHYRIPYKFEPVRDNPQQRGERLWSDSNDIKITLLAGWTPFETMDFSLSWTYQDSNKGFSPPDVNGRDYQIWEWPYYDRQSVVFDGVWKPDHFTVKTNIYFQKFDNRMVDYGSWLNYEFGMHNPYSDYDDYTFGFHIEGAWEINNSNKVEAALNFRKDDHKGLTGEKLGVHVNEDIWSFAAEYTINPWKDLRFVAGLGVDAIVPNEFMGENNELMKELGFSYIDKTKSWTLFAAEAGAFYEITKTHELHFTYARKNHFPTMSQRYSTRFGESTPNPRLGPEEANHFELGWNYMAKLQRENTSVHVRANAAFYYSDVFNKIVEIRVPNPQYTATTVSYTVNLDRTAMWGFEAGGELSPIKQFSAGGAFSWNRYSILKSWLDVRKLTLYPDITASLYTVISPIPPLQIIPSMQYTGARYVDTKGEQELESYILFNLKLTYKINERFSAAASIENIFDALYEIKQYSPMPGRSYSFSLTGKY